MSNYYKKDGVASRCKQMLHCGDQFERSCNKFTHIKHFKNRTEMVPLISLALSLMCYRNNIFVQGMLIDSNEFKTEIYSEFTTTYMPQILLDTHISEGKEKLINKLNISTPTPEGELYKNIKFEEKIADKNTDIKSSIHFPAALFTETIQSSTSKHSNSSPTLENLNKQYENKSMTEFATTHMPQILLDTQILKNKEKSLNNFGKILTKNPEEESYNNIKHEEKIGDKNIEEKEESYNNIKYEENIGDKNMDIKSSIDTAASFAETIKNFTRKHSNPSSALENLNRLSVPKREKIFSSEKISLENFEKDISENTYSNEDTFRQQQQIIKKFETNYSADVSKYIFDQQDFNENLAISENNLPQNCVDSVCEVNTTKYDVHITEDNNVNLNKTEVDESASEIINELPNINYTTLSYDSIDFVTQNYDSNNKDNILSVDLHETISRTPNNSNEIDVLNITDYPQLYFEEVTKEVENANDSCVDEEYKHVVIKKVLVQQHVIEYPFLQNDEKNLIELTYTDQYAQENKTTNGSTNKNYTLDLITINERTISNALESENITDCTSIESSEENTFTADYYQSTGAINQNENNVVKNESKQHLEQDNSVNIKKEVDELLWKSGEERSLNELHHEKHVKQGNDQYNQTDKYSESIGTETLKNNTYLSKIEKTNYENHETHEVTSTTLRTINESEAPESNISEISYINTNNTTEKYENNYIFIIQNEQIVQSNLTEPVNDYNSVSKQVTPLLSDDIAATLFETYPPQDVGQTFNDNLADESDDFGKALPVSITEGSNRSTIIIAMSSATAILFIIISVTIFLISFQHQHGTLDIEMQERNCGKDDLDDEDAQTIAKLLQVELPPSVAVALDECEECL